MAKKKNKINVVYSTNPDYQYNYDEEAQETLPPNQQELKVFIDRKNRKGKEVTVVSGFVGSEEDLKKLAKELKNKCGVGGSQKDGDILVQGSLKVKIHDLLINMGYKAKMSGG